jgi:protoporphyrinogen/coproporphyrinogen III oxidase
MVSPLKTRPQVVIVGGGITGLSAAHTLAGQARVTLLESDARLGGKLRSATLETSLGKAIVDGGAESFITRKPEAYNLALELGLQAELLDPGAETMGVYLWRDNAMLEVPTNPAALLRTRLLSWAGKWRLLREPFTPASNTETDESLTAFLERRLGREAAQVFAPVMAGIYNTDPTRQSLSASFPILRELERDGGSLVRGMLKRVRGQRSHGTGQKPPRAISFKRGVGVLVEALETRLRSQPDFEIRTNTRVTALSRTGSQHRVQLESGETILADAIILACPANVSANLLEHAAPDAARALGRIQHSSIGTLALAYPAKALEPQAALRGLMIPRGQKRAVDAVLFTSAKMPSRVAPGVALLRVFFGANRPDLMQLDDAALLEVVSDELRVLLGLEAEPLASETFRWENSFPLLEVGHLEHVAAAERALPNGVLLAGASYRGLGVPDCVRQGRGAARQALEFVQSQILK